MHCRLAKLEASQRKGRQTTVTLQAGGQLVGHALAQAQSQGTKQRLWGLIFHLQSRPCVRRSRSPRNTGPSLSVFHMPHCREKEKLSRDNGADYGKASSWGV